MSSLLQKVANQAVKTFKAYNKHGAQGKFQENLVKLKEIMHGVTAEDTSLDGKLVKDLTPYDYHAYLPEPSARSAPVTYVHIWENETFSMGIFVLRNGASLPLHDHPDMHGLIKLIHGTVRVKRYSHITIHQQLESPNSPNPCTMDQQSSVNSVSGGVRHPQPLTHSVTRLPDKILDPTCEPCILTPVHENFHDIKAVNGPAAFLDILSPPYHTSGPHCHYYKECHMHSSQYKPNHTEEDPGFSLQLMEIPQPREFWCDAAPYRGSRLMPYEDR